MVMPRNRHKPTDSANNSRDHHRTDRYRLHINSCILCRPLGFSNDSDLIPMLRLGQIKVYGNCQNHDCKKQPGILASEQIRKISCLCSLVQLSEGRRRPLPLVIEKVHQLNCHIVHHQGKQRFIYTHFRLKNCRQDSPDCRQCQGADKHNQIQKRGRQIPAINHHDRGCQSSCKNLSFSSTVPETHLKCRGKRHGNTQKLCRIEHGIPQVNGIAKYSLPHVGDCCPRTDSCRKMHKQYHQ